MAALEVILAIILTFLGLAILAILIVRWTRRRQNQMQISRYTSEQSAGLLDYEDGVFSARRKRGKGSRSSYSMESDSSKAVNTPSSSSLGRILSDSSLRSSGSNLGKTKSTALSREPFPGTIGPIMQFSAPIPGATGPIKLSQKTIVHTPGPIVQFTGSSGETSETSPMESAFGMHPEARSGSPPVAINSGPPTAKPVQCPSSTPVVISQKTATRPEPPAVRKEPTHIAVPIITPVPVALTPIGSVDSSGNITLPPMVIFPGYTDGDHHKKSDPKIQIIKYERTSSIKKSPEESGESLRKKILVDCYEHAVSPHTTQPEGQANGPELEKDKSCTGSKLEPDPEEWKRHEPQEKSETGVPRGGSRDSRREKELSKRREFRVSKSEVEVPKRREEFQISKSETNVPKRQESQVRFGTSVSNAAEGQARRSATATGTRRDSPVRHGENAAQADTRARAATEPAAQDVGADAAAPAERGPRVQAPRVQAPRVQAPRVQAPRVQAPRVQAPRVQAPRVQAPAEAPPRAPENQVISAAAAEEREPPGEAPAPGPPQAPEAQETAARAEQEPQAEAPAQGPPQEPEPRPAEDKPQEGDAGARDKERRHTKNKKRSKGKKEGGGGGGAE